MNLSCLTVVEIATLSEMLHKDIEYHEETSSQLHRDDHAKEWHKRRAKRLMELHDKLVSEMQSRKIE